MIIFAVCEKIFKFALPIIACNQHGTILIIKGKRVRLIRRIIVFLYKEICKYAVGRQSDMLALLTVIVFIPASLSVLYNKEQE